MYTYIMYVYMYYVKRHLNIQYNVTQVDKMCWVYFKGGGGGGGGGISNLNKYMYNHVFS